ncbi:tetratricopeptide repeat protein [Crateriforma spongiae]|uniref:tetratricopeptide repeat protein n=1 Tax=Crateriforma spongiae TaxID=2724528 RepID=UPI0014457CB0|nr:tetratricopeptide repeat protein [Crateriforma spongiae]
MISAPQPSPILASRRRHTALTTTWSLVALACVTGCQSIPGTPTGFGEIFGRPDESMDTTAEPPARENLISQVSHTTESDIEPAAADKTTWEATQDQATSVMNFVTGREQVDHSKAKELYQQGDAEFRRASGMDRQEAQDAFLAAAKLFKRAAEAAPGTAIEQDAMMMRGESLFFADRLPDAVDVYQTLQKDFPRNRHNDRVAARLFSISRYWIDVERATEDDWFTLDLFDRTKPRLDADGNAVRVLDQIRYDDPTGRLADDATMAAAAEYIRQGKFERADEFLTDLRESFPDSEHLFLAHLMGIRCKLEVYAGPHYSALLLDEADKLVQQTRTRFPDKMRDQKYADMVARAAAEIDYLKAEKLFKRAQYRDKQKYFGAAAGYYQRILDNYPDTPFAETARERLQAVNDQPVRPAKRLSWLQNLFPDRGNNKPPLEPTYETILR